MSRPGPRTGLLSRIDANSLLHGGLLALLLVLYVTVIYVAVVAALVLFGGERLQPELVTPWWTNAIGLAVVAATFLPVARMLHRRTADLVYAEHDNPWAVVERMAQPLQILAEPEKDLPPLAATIAAELRLPALTIEWLPPEGGADAGVRATVGTPPRGAEMVRLPILHQEQAYGALMVSTRGAGRSLTGDDRALLEEVARRLGILFHSFALSASLQAARERLVLAREEERRRLRNDLHDGLAPTLAALQLHLGAVRALIASDPALAAARVDDLREELRTATGSIRQIVYELRPPKLDDLGMVGALRALRLPDALTFAVHAPDPMPRLPAAVEVAAFRIATEAVQNVVRHADARICTVRLAVEGRLLTLEVEDDGRGVAADAGAGVGSHSMRERAAELGGTVELLSAAATGTILRAQLPLEGRA